MQLLTTFLFVLFGHAAHAEDSFTQSLRKVEPKTRLEQVCDVEAIKQIKRDLSLPADRAKAEISSSPIHSGDTVIANGGAFRAAGKWYHLSFVCTGTPDHLRVTEFTYKVGKAIPESQWEDLGLWR